MPFFLAVGGFAVVIAILVLAVWKLWLVELRIWMIPRRDIESAAEGLRCRLGQEGARRHALESSLMACQRGDIVEHGRWDRILRFLKSAKRTKS